MKWNKITDEPKQKNRTILFICLDRDGTISCTSDVWNSWDDAHDLRNEKFNGWSATQYSHWTYLNPPK